ncbi:MAG TPA: hypothetical protein VLA41_12080, partial [Burkholderiales bacterium]|nr:hypothetical protein [Burkholderiales bacterium]
MADLIKRYHPPGTPPGTLTRRERRKPTATRIALVSYDESRLEEFDDATPAQCARYRGLPSTTWIHVSGHPEV